jgi:hypothetical protein
MAMAGVESCNIYASILLFSGSGVLISSRKKINYIGMRNPELTILDVDTEHTKSHERENLSLK